MRISSNQIYQRGLNSMLTQQAKTLNLQQQISSQKKVSTAADDPIAAARIDLMKQRIANSERLQQNKDTAQSTLSFEENIVSNSVSVLQRIREIQVAAGNSALSDSDRKSLATEARVLLDELQGLANTQDSNGYYLFSGSKTASPSFTRDSAGQYIYNGDDTQRSQTITNGLTIPVSDTGSDLFMRIPNGNGHFSISPTAVPNTGSGVLTSGSIVNQAAYVEDTYTLQFALNTQNQLVVMVSGAASGNVLPLTGLPDDAPVYQNGMGVTFNGMQITASGDPQAGDAFTIAPATNQSIFATVTAMINNLNSPSTSSPDRARITTENNQLLGEVDNALSNLLNGQAEIGARMNQITIAEQINGDSLENSQDTLSKLQDADLSAVIVQLNLQMIYLQAAQQSFTKIQGLSAFNFMR